VKKSIIALLVTGLFILVGCSQVDPTPTMVAEATAVPPTATASQAEEIVEATPEIEVIDSVEELAGTWQFGTDQFRRFFEDGTSFTAPSLDQLKKLIAGEIDYNDVFGDEYPDDFGEEYWFEDGLFHVKDNYCIESEAVSEAGIYQIQRVDNERIRFVQIEDPCWYRGVRVYRETATMTRIEEE